MAGQTVEVALGSPGPSATFQIPPKLVPFVDSVFAEIDNSAGAATTPTLEVKGPNGDTVAAVPQDSTVPGGDTGRATWALRLAAKPRAASGGKMAFATAWNDHFNGDPQQVVLNGATEDASFANALPSPGGEITFSTSSVPNDTAHLNAAGTYLLWVGTHFSLTSPNLTSIIYSPGTTINVFPHLPFTPGTAPTLQDGIGSAQSQDFTVANLSTGGFTERVSLCNLSGIDEAAQQCYFVILYLATG